MGRHISSDIISIHALREEGDTAAVVGTAATCGFLSTPSVRRATPLIRLYNPENKISIHALREEGDVAVIFPPLSNSVFLSTPSVRRATVKVCAEDGRVEISIHALREEGDRRQHTTRRRTLNFYPRPP